MNLLATGIIIYASLTIGRQVLEWWRADPSPIGPSGMLEGPGELGRLDRPHVLEAAELPLALRRQEIEGDLDAAFAALRASCRAAAERGGKLSESAGPAELRLLQRIAKTDPVEQQAGKWQIYQLDGPLPLVAATAAVGSGQQQSGAEVAAAKLRVVSWGLAVRLSGTRWTLFTLEASGPLTGAAGLPPLPIPPRCQRTLSLRAEAGEAMVGFSGQANLEECRQLYDRWFAQQGWPRSDDWRAVSGQWHARYTAEGGQRVDVQLAPRAAGSMTGILAIGAAPSEAEEK